MMTVRAASSAMLSGALVQRKVVLVYQKLVPQEAEAQEMALREAVPQEVRLQETQAVAAVVPAAMTTTITTHRAAVAEAAEDNGEVENMDKSSPSTDGAALFFGRAVR